MKNKKILFVATVPQMLKAFLLPFADHFRALGFRVDAMAADLKEVQALHSHFDKTWDVDFSRNPLKLAHLFSLPKTIRSIIKTEQYSIVHVHTPVAAFVTRLALRNFGENRPKVIYTAHGFHFYQGGSLIRNTIFLALEKIAGKWTDELIVINREDETAARKYHLVPDDKLHYLPGIGINLEKFSSAAIGPEEVNTLHKELGLTDNDRYFLMIAEFTKQKNQAFAVNAFLQLQDSNVHLFFAGTGANLLAIQNRVKELGLEQRVHFLGFRTDIPRLICGSSAVLLLSEREGLPLSIMEAMCLKKAGIGTNVRGIRDLLGDGAGILVPGSDIKSLVDAMRFILQHPEQASEMGEIGYEQVKQYDLKNIILWHEKLYNGTL